MLNVKNCNIKDFYCLVKNNKRKVYAFGVSRRLETHTKLRIPDYNILDITYKLVDNDVKKWDNFYIYKEKKIEIISPEKLKKCINKTDIIWIISIHYNEILKQLNNIDEFDGIECYILDYINAYPDSKIDELFFEKSKSYKFCIPPILHYCWFGNKSMPDEFLEYIETWKRYCPNYNIIKWTEENYDVMKHPYMYWAYKNKKWAFVSDYARLDIIYNHGGIYLDTDVEIIKNLDELRRFHAFIGYESTQMLGTGLGIGAEKGNDVIRKLRDDYDDIEIKAVNEMMPCTVYQTNVMRKLGLKCDNSFQLLCNNQIAILPTEFLCGIRLFTKEKQITKHTFTLHHYSGNW